MSDHHSESKGYTKEEIMQNNIPIHLRDNCVNLLIPLNNCRRENFFSPLACEHQRHSYEICLYHEYEKRKEIKENGLDK